MSMLTFGSSRERPRRQTAGLLRDREHAAFGDGDDDVLLGAGCHTRINPFDESRVRAHAGADEKAFLVVVGIPVVAGQFLVMPDQLAGLDAERHGRVAVELFPVKLARRSRSYRSV